MHMLLTPKYMDELDMGFPADVPYNPTVTPVANLGPSSGDPKALRDPKSIASLGSKLQAMTDQANADTLYDSSNKEGFLGQGQMPAVSEEFITALLIGAGVGFVAFSFFMDA
jgi:hypothetical protein